MKEEIEMKDVAIAASWSGGKDGCLALHRAVNAGARVACLVTMFIEGGERSRSHGLHRRVIDAQAQAMGFELLTRAVSWAEYERGFVDVLKEARALGATAGVFGDIDVQAHREWEEKVCAAAGMTAVLPIWQEGRRALVGEVLGLGYEVKLVATRDAVMGDAYLGRTLTPELAQELESKGIDACGENGEFHTVVVDGPLFKRRVEVKAGRKVLRDGVWFLDYEVGV